MSARLQVAMCKSSHAAKLGAHKVVTGPTHIVLCIHVSAVLQQQPSALQVPDLCSIVQRR